MLKKLFAFFFCVQIFAVSLAGTLFAADAVLPQENSGASVEINVIPEKLFYTATLNESVFINSKDALYNTRATMKVLQGKLESVVFEVLGEGDIISVNGSQVKDWSVRRAGARTFVEIRPKQGIAVGEIFNATIVGRKPLELPTTLMPMMLTGTDATAFSGLVRIVSTPDIRLYGKQSRGLMPIGTIEKNELAFSISGTPSLRLDIARGNELLAPVSLESFSLKGKVVGNAAHFRIHAMASVREIGAEIAVLSGEAALSNFAASSDFSVRTEISETTKQPVYYLKFPQRGDFEIDLEFDARILEEDGWKRLDFAVPAVQVAPFSLEGLAGEIFFAPSSVSVPQQKNGAYEGFLPANGNFDLRWQEVSGTPPEFSACVFSADTCSEWRVSTGILKQREEISLLISQGTLSNLVFDLLGEGDVLDVSGEDVLSWNIEKSSGEGDIPARKLNVILSRKKRGSYVLRLETQSMFSTLPTTFNPLRVVPVAKQPDAAVCVRFNEFLRVVNDGVLRSEVLPQNGLTQIAESAFPQKGDFFKPVSANSEQTVYRISNSEKAVALLVDAIRPDVSVTQAIRCYFDTQRIVAASFLEMKIRSAPLYEWTILVPDGYKVDAVETEYLAGYELADSAENGFRKLKIVFTEPRLGEQSLYVGVSKQIEADRSDCKLWSLRYPEARFVRGFVGFTGAKNVRLIPSELEGLTEVPVEFFPRKRGTLPQQVFRMRGADWKAEVDIEKTLSSAHGEIASVYRIERNGIGGSAFVSYDCGTEIVEEIRFALPENAKFVRFENADLFLAPTEKNGELTAQLRTPMHGKFSFRVFFEIPFDEKTSVRSADFSGLRLLGVAGEQGEIFVTSNEAVAIAEPEEHRNSPSVLKIARGDVSEKQLEKSGNGNVLLCAYQYVRRPFNLTVDFVLLPKRKPADCVITETTGTLVKCNGENGLFQKIVWRFDYFNTEREFLNFVLPNGTILLSQEPFELSGNSDAQSEMICTIPLDIKNGRGSFEIELCGGVLSPENSLLKLTPPRVDTDVPVLATRFEGAGEFVNVAFDNGRHVRETWNEIAVSSLVAAKSSRELLPAFCVFAGTLVILLATRLKKIWHFFLGGISAVALCVVMMIEASILRECVSPHYDLSVATFGAGENVAVEFTPWTSLGERILGLEFVTTLGIWMAGAFLLAAGAVWRRSAILRFFGRLGFYGAFIFGTTDIEHRIPALIVAFVATELILLVVDLGFLLKERFSKESSVKNPASISLGLFAGTLALSALSGIASPELRADDLKNELARPQEIAEYISQSLNILTDRVVASGEIRLKGRAGERFDLLASPAVLTHFAKTDPEMPIRLERRHGKNGIVHQIVLDRSGTFSAEFAYELALQRDARGMTLPTGNAAADVVFVSIARPDSRLSAEGEVTLAVEPTNEMVQTGKIVFKPLEKRRILWNPRQRDRKNESPELVAEGSDLYVPASGTIEGFHIIKISPVLGEFDEVKIKIPEPFSVSRVEGNSIRRWNFGRDKILTLLFDSKRSEPVEISVYTQAPLDITKPQQFSSLQVLDCKNSVTTIGVATGNELQLDEVKAPNLSGIDEKEFSAKLLARAATSGIPIFLRRAFRSVEGAASCQAVLSEVKPNLRITSKDKIVLNQDKVSIVMDLTAEVSRADVFNLSFPLPEGLELESVSGDSLAYWTESQDAADLRTVTLFLKKALVGEEQFRISLVGAFPFGAPTWTIPRVLFNGAQRQSGELLLFTEEGLRLRLRSRNNLIEISPGEVDAEGSEKKPEIGNTEELPDFSFRYFGNRWNATFAIGASEKRSFASWRQCVTPLVFSRYARVDIDCIHTVENTTCQVVRVALPSSALAPRFYGDGVVSAVPVKTDVSSGAVSATSEKNVWEVRFAKPMRGEILFKIEYFEVLSPKMKITSVSVLDVAEERGRLEIIPGKIFSPAQYLPLIENVDFSGKSVELEVVPVAVKGWEKLKSGVQEGSFSAPQIRRFSRISDNGFVTAETIELDVIRTDLLRIAPTESEILSVRVNDVPADIFVGEDGSSYLLLRKNASNESTRIHLLYRGKFSPAQSGIGIVEPLRTSAYPGHNAMRPAESSEGESAEALAPCMAWTFVGDIAGKSFEPEKVFGRVATECRQTPDSDIPKCLLGGSVREAETQVFAYETADYPSADPGATIVFFEDKTASGRDFSRERWAFGILALVVLLRIIIAVVFRRKRRFAAK